MFKMKNHNTSTENSSDLNTNTVFIVIGKETQTVSDQSSQNLKNLQVVLLTLTSTALAPT